MAPMFDARLAAAAALQLSRGKSSQNLHTFERLDVVDAGQGGRVWPSTTAALVASQQLSSPYMLPSEACFSQYSVEILVEVEEGDAASSSP